MFDCFRRIAPSSAGLANDVIPFLARDANENLASETSRPFATFTSRTKNHDSLSKTFSPGIIVRSTCGKSMEYPMEYLNGVPLKIIFDVRMKST